MDVRSQLIADEYPDTPSWDQELLSPAFNVFAAPPPLPTFDSGPSTPLICENVRQETSQCAWISQAEETPFPSMISVELTMQPILIQVLPIAIYPAPMPAICIPRIPPSWSGTPSASSADLRLAAPSTILRIYDHLDTPDVVLPLGMQSTVVRLADHLSPRPHRQNSLDGTQLEPRRLFELDGGSS